MHQQQAAGGTPTLKLQPQARESDMYDLSELPGVPPGTALRPLPDPDCEDGHIPYEAWDTGLKAVYHMHPKRITYQRVAKSKAFAWYCRNSMGRLQGGKCKTAMQACQLFVDLNLGE